MTGALQGRRSVARDARALAAAMVQRFDGDAIRALVAIRTTWRTRPDAHELQVAVRAFASIMEGLTMAEREVWMCWHSDIEDVSDLARAIAGRHARHIQTARTRQVSA